jgi:hypothetical protein
MDSPHHRAKRGVGRMETGIRASNTYGYSLSKRANRAFGVSLWSAGCAYFDLVQMFWYTR